MNPKLAILYRDSQRELYAENQELQAALDAAEERIRELEYQLENLRYDHRKLEQHDEKVTATLMDGTEAELEY